VRLIRANCLRLVTDDEEKNSVRIYYCVENSREYQEVEPQFLEVDAENAPAIEALLSKYPDYLTVEDLPIEELDTKMKVVQDLWERKLLLTKVPLEAHYDD
jgi:lysine-specific demethylase/histidyl-hydroxylase NO66